MFLYVPRKCCESLFSFHAIHTYTRTHTHIQMRTHALAHTPHTLLAISERLCRHVTAKKCYPIVFLYIGVVLAMVCFSTSMKIDLPGYYIKIHSAIFFYTNCFPNLYCILLSHSKLITNCCTFIIQI